MQSDLTFPKKYKFQEIEKKWQEKWEGDKIYKWDESQPRENTYVIDTPPPTVSGMLHMGHVFSYCQADFVARYQRMKGKTVFYPMGFDDNGLPTERLVEKVKKVKGSKMPRNEFVALCKEVVVDAEDEFRDLFKSIALSVDWDQEYHTISDSTRKISQMSFLDLYSKNLMERKYEPCYWDVIDQTALSQADIEDKEMLSQMIDISFALDGTDDSITIATTRPELIPACVAIFVHPEDERYKNLIGKNALTALFKTKVPILGDSLVEKDKGTGIVMCCTFGDMTDVMWWKSHKLKSRVILNKYGKIKDFLNSENEDDLNLLEDIKENSDFLEYSRIYSEIIGLNVKNARIKIVELLENAQVILARQDLTHPVKCAERSGQPIEVMLTEQWFIKILQHKKELLAQAEKANWYPKHMKIRVDQWIEGLSYDWCISRQRFFGVPFPVWYVSEEGAEEMEVVTADVESLPIDPIFTLPKGFELVEKIKDGEFKAKKDNKIYHIIAESDVMDTWATSSVSPQISSGAINKNYAVDLERHKKLFPADLRPQAHEIIRSWAFYTLVKSYYHENEIPWKNLMISGWCLASDKTKMSKSKGNVVTPTSLIEEKGSDIVRYWAATSHLGSDTAYSEDVLAIGKKLTTKLFNAAKFASGQLHKADNPDFSLDLQSGRIFFHSDLWILDKLKTLIKNIEEEFDRYEYAKALNHLDNFFWKDFCDYYLEISKTRAYGDKEQMGLLVSDLDEEKIGKDSLSAVHTLHFLIDNILKLYAPFIPHVTDELHQIIFANKSSIHERGSWPKVKDEIKTEDFSEILEIIDFIRKNKSDNSFSIKKEIKTLSLEGEWNEKIIKENYDLKFVCNINNIEFIKGENKNIKITYIEE